MKKLIDLREHLLQQVPQLTTNPEQLLTYIESGKIAYSAGKNLSHRYVFQAVVVVTDWHHDADNIFIPLLAWLSVKEPGFDPEETLTFEADILSLQSIDIIIKVNLTERVIVTDGETGRTITHVIPPAPIQFEQGASLQFIVEGPLGGSQIPER